MSYRLDSSSYTLYKHNSVETSDKSSWRDDILLILDLIRCDFPMCMGTLRLVHLHDTFLDGINYQVPRYYTQGLNIVVIYLKISLTTRLVIEL